jgi:transposase
MTSYKAQQKGLSNRLQKAEEKIQALTPPVGRGRKQITDEVDLLQKVSQILKHYKVELIIRVNGNSKKYLDKKAKNKAQDELLPSSE